MYVVQLYRRLEARDRERRLRSPFIWISFGLTLLVAALGAWILDSRIDEPSGWALIGLCVAVIAFSMLSKHLFWRVQRRRDAAR
jgi:hypothetical protein